MLTRVYPKAWGYETYISKNTCLFSPVDDLHRMISVEEQSQGYKLTSAGATVKGIENEYRQKAKP